ncbi:PKD domain-containing protein [Ferruginibacter yonginensis]|uniref:PKD domain-containing protein n=1 Tax=Ferruginibacter yonginensis TaxID=1310416 RepID=A0ABV8QQE1_9BACT
MGANSLLKYIYLTVLCTFIVIVTNAQLVPQFTATPVSGCAPLVVNFTDQSTGGATQWQWNLGNSTISNLQNPSTTYFTPGTYTVKLVITNAAGTKDSITKVQYITVNAAPTVAFTATPLTGCFPLNVQFTDGSTPGSGSISSWFWDFGDGNTSTQQNPSHIYTAAGSFNVSLIITNSTGCSKTLTKANYIVTNTGITAAFTNSTPTGCSLPETIIFQNQSTGTGVLSYQWNFGDGGTSTSANPSHTYTTAGSFTVQLIVTNSTGCRDTIIKNNLLSVGTVHADFTTPATICVGDPITFTNTSTPNPSSVSWTFGDATTSTQINPIKIYTTPGTYNVTLVSNFGGCSDNITHSVTVLPKPTASFVANTTSSCSAPLTVSFNNTSTSNVTNQWLFGDGGTSTLTSPTHTYTTFGSYTVTLITTNSNGCSDTLVKTNYINIAPIVASINNLPQQGCAPLSVTFAGSINSTDPIASYQWDFGDGTTSNQTNPTHVFSAGSYNIQLIVTTTNGCIDTVIVNNGVIATIKPIANFDATPRISCANLPISFQNLSTNTLPTTTWQWFFGDGAQSNVQNPNHEYSDTGYFNVTLVVSNNGCNDTLVLNNFVYIKAPIANFSFQTNCVNKYTRTFRDLSIGADEWNWNFGDGITSTLQEPTHTYAAVGTYTVTLFVKNYTTGCDYTKVYNVLIADEVAQFTAVSPITCKNIPVTFNATSQQAQPSIATYSWDFGDGTTAFGGPSVNHAYTTPGNYSVRLIITDGNGCADTLVRPNYIRVNGPTAAFVPSSVGSCLQSSISFTDQSITDGVNAITHWYWNYGDNIFDTLTAPPFQHAYNAPGIYPVSLIVKDAAGCLDSIIKLNLLTISQPQASFSSIDTVSCPNKPVHFLNQSTGPGLTFVWHFGDGNTSTQIEPTHQYAADGNYTIQLDITDQYGCTSQQIRNQYIKINTPFANYAVSDSVSTCPPLVVQFTNTSTNYDTYVWDFGDGSTSQVANPSHLYNTPGTYFSKLTITSPGGCVTSKTRRIVVRGPQGNFTYTALTGCSPLVVNFTATTQDRLSFIWDFNDGNTIATTDSMLSHTYATPGIYIPKMILKDAAGCTVPIQGIDTIKVFGVQALFTVDTTLRCNSGSIQFTNASISNDNIIGYTWNFGDGTTSTDINPTHFYATTGTYTPTLTANTTLGCNNTVAATVPIKVVKTPELSFTQPNNGCMPLTASFNATLVNADTSVVTYQYETSNGLQGNTPNFSTTFNNSGIYTATMYATNSSGCKDTATVSVEAFAKPTVVAVNDITICQGTGQPISATGAATYTWSPSIGLNCTNCATPIATPDSVREYTVTGYSAQGCSNTDVIKVSVKYPFQMQRGSGDTLCKGQSALLNVSGAASYIWSPSTGLNNTTSATVTATPSTTTNYMVVGTDDKNCFKDTAYFPVKVYPIPTVTAGADKTINVGQTITLTPTISNDVTNVVWTPSLGVVSNVYPSINIRPTTDMQYKVTVSNAGGCTANATVNIIVLCNGANVFIPNTFSPNGDGANEVFYPRGTGLFTIKQARIFDRWGQEVFSRYSFAANDASKGWDGTYKGKKLGSDVYVYVFEIQCENNTTMMYKGNIALIL